MFHTEAEWRASHDKTLGNGTSNERTPVTAAARSAILRGRRLWGDS